MKCDKSLLYLAEHLNKTFSLPEFAESYAGCRLKWSKNGKTALCNCPLPGHRDSNASFRINFLHDNIWIFHCFGCNKSGTLVSFCRDFEGLDSWLSAIEWLCKYYKITDTQDLIIKGMANVSKKMDTTRIMENMNIVISRRLHRILRKNLERNRQWVSLMYKKLNMAMDGDDIGAVESIENESIAYERNGVEKHETETLKEVV